MDPGNCSFIIKHAATFIFPDKKCTLECGTKISPLIYFSNTIIIFIVFFLFYIFFDTCGRNAFDWDKFLSEGFIISMVTQLVNPSFFDLIVFISIIFFRLYKVKKSKDSNQNVNNNDQSDLVPLIQNKED